MIRKTCAILLASLACSAFASCSNQDNAVLSNQCASQYQVANGAIPSQATLDAQAQCAAQTTEADLTCHLGKLSPQTIPRPESTTQVYSPPKPKISMEPRYHANMNDFHYAKKTTKKSDGIRWF